MDLSLRETRLQEIQGSDFPISLLAGHMYRRVAVQWIFYEHCASDAHLLGWRRGLQGREGSLDDVIGLSGRRALPGRVFQAVIYELGYTQRALLRYLHSP